MADYETMKLSNSKKKKKRKQIIAEEEEEEQQQQLRRPSKSSRVDDESNRAEAEQSHTSLKLEDNSPWTNLQLILSLQNKDIHLETKLELVFEYVQSRTREEVDDSSQGLEVVSISRVIIFLNNWVQSLLIASEKKIRAEGNNQPLEISGSCFDYRCWVVFKFCLEESLKLHVSLSFSRDLLRVIHCIVEDQFHRLNGEALHVKQSLSGDEELEKLCKIVTDCVSLVFSSHGGVSNENLDLWVWVISTVLKLVQKILHDEIYCSNAGVILLQLSCYLLEAFAKFLRVHPARKNGFHDFIDKLLAPLLHLLNVLHVSVGGSDLGLRKNLLKLIEEVVSQGIFHPTHIDGFLSLRSTSRYKTSEDAKSKEGLVVLKSYHKHLIDKLDKIISQKNVLALGGIGELFRLFLNCIKRQKGVTVSRDEFGLLNRGSTTNTFESSSGRSNFVSENSHYSGDINAETRKSVFDFFVQIMEFFVSEIDIYLQAELRGGPILVDIHCLLRSINCLLASFVHEKVYRRAEDISEGASINFLKVIYDKVMSFSAKINKFWSLSFGSDEKKLWEVLLLIAKELTVAVHYILDTEYEVVGDDLESLWAILLSYTACSDFLRDLPAQYLLTSEILKLGCRVIDLYSELRQVNTSIFALCKALRRMVSPHQISEACTLSHSCGSFPNSLSMILCSLEFRHSICNAIKSIPEGQASGCIRQLAEDVSESLEWVKIKCQIASENGCVEPCSSSADSLSFNLQVELLGRGLSELYTLILGSMTVTSGNSNLVGISMKDLMEVVRPHLSILVSQQPEGIYLFLSTVTGKTFTNESEYRNTHWILVFFCRLYLSYRCLCRQVISLMPPNTSRKMSGVMGDMLTAYSGMDWVEKSSFTDEGYFSWIIRPSAPLPNVLYAVSDVYLQDTVIDHSSLIYVLSAMALQRIVDLSRLIKSIEYLIQRNDYLIHSRLVDDAGLSVYRKRSRNWKSCVLDLRQEAAALTKFMMRYLWLLPEDQLSISSFVDSNNTDKSSNALHEHAWDLSIGAMDEKSLPSAIWWIICQNVDIWCVHAAKKDLKKFLSRLIRISVPLVSCINDFKEDKINKPSNQKVTMHEISLELLSDTILYEQQFVRRHMASRFCRTLEKSVSSIFSDVEEIDLNSKPDLEEIIRALENPSSVVLGNKSVEKDHSSPLEATSHLLGNLSAESCQKEQLVPVVNIEFAVCQSLLSFLSWMPKGHLSSKSFKLYATCILNLERLTVGSLLSSREKLCLPDQYELVQLFVSCRRALKNLMTASCEARMEGCRSSLSSVLMETPAPISWLLKSLSAVIELQHTFSKDTTTQLKETILPMMDQTSSLLFSLSKNQFECAIYSLISAVDASGENPTSVVNQEETDGTNAWKNVVILAETIKEHMHNTHTSAEEAFLNKKVNFLTSNQELKRLSTVMSCCQGFLWGLASALDKVDARDGKFGKMNSGSKVDFIHEINLCIDTCANFVNYFIRVLFFEDDHLPRSLSSVKALNMSECNDNLTGTGKAPQKDYADVDDALENVIGKSGSIGCFSQSSKINVQSSKCGQGKDSSPENADLEALLIKIEHEQQCLKKPVLQGLLRGHNIEAAFFLRQLLIASSAIFKLNLQINQTSSSWSLIPVLIGISEVLLLEFVSKISMPQSLSFVWLDGAVKFLEQLGSYFPLANPLLSRSLYAKLIDLHLRALGKCISLQGKRATLASQERESSTKMLNGQGESSEHAVSQETYGLEEFKAMLRTSFIVFVKQPSEFHLLSAVQAIERAVVGVQDGCMVNYEIHTGSSDGGKVSMTVAAGIDCLDLILENVTGRKRLSLVKRHIQSLVASLFNVLLHMQGPNIFYQNVNSNKSHADPDSGSVVLMCIDILTRVFGKHALFQMDPCHVAQSLRVPAALFQNLSQLQISEAPNSLIASDIGDTEDVISTNSSDVDRQFSIQLYAACCRLLCTVLKHHKSETQRCFALLEDSVSVLLRCLEMVNVDLVARKYNFAWEVQEGVKCACFLRRVYEEIRQQKDVFGHNCFQLLSNYIWVYCGFGPLKIGIRREIDEALRPGIYALIDACSTDDLQHLHTAFGEGPCRSTLANLQHDYTVNFQYEGKV